MVQQVQEQGKDNIAAGNSSVVEDNKQVAEVHIEVFDTENIC